MKSVTMLLTMLERLLEAAKKGDFSIALNPAEYSGIDAKIAGMLNDITINYRSAVEYDLMKYRLTGDALGIALWDMGIVDGDLINPQNTFSWSQEFRHLLGYTDEGEFPNVFQSWSDRIHPEDRERTLAAFKSHVADHTGQTPYDIEYRLKLKNGAYHHFRAFGTTLRDKNGVPLRVAGGVEDINEKKQMAGTIKYREKLLTTLNEIDITLLSHKGSRFEEVLGGGFRAVADAAELDRIVIYRLLGEGSEKYFGQIYRWDNDENGFMELDKELKILPQIPAITNWIEILEKGDIVNIHNDIMSEDERGFLSVFGVKSILLTPITVDDELWGSFTFQDHTEARVFDDDCVGFLNAAARICASAIIRREKTVDAEKAMTGLKRRERMMSALNQMATIFLTRHRATFEELMTIGVRPIIDLLDLDRVSIWRSYLNPDGIRISQIYRWNKSEGGTTKPFSHLFNTTYEAAGIPRWEGLLMSGRSINSPSKLLPETEVLDSYGIASIFASPIFMNDEFWGFALFEDQQTERFFEDDSAEMMRSAAFLFANAVVINEKNRSIAEANEKLSHALELATAASKAKGDFLSTMSHEMRTPMNAIIGMTAIGKKAGNTEQKNHALDKIQNASSHLLGIINDVLDMAKIEVNKLELTLVEYDFGEMLQKVMGVINFKVEEKMQHFTVDVDSKIPRFIIGDDKRLAQVITNLLSNAVKFTPEGGSISLEAFLAKETGDAFELRVEIADSGIGITREQQSRLFHAFEQAESGISREYGGTGLGLTISKRIIELMGGDIHIESEPGKGTRFIFTVKARRCQNANIPENTGCNCSNEIKLDDCFKGKKMLLAEDVMINREILINLLEDTGIIIESAENGKEALDMVSENPNKYDIVFMDVQMPQMDGLESTRRIRALPALKDINLPIIAMTANVFKDDVEACLNAGMDGHIGKPLDMDVVFDVLRKYL